MPSLRFSSLLALALVAPPSPGRPAEPPAGATAADQAAPSPAASGPKATPAPADSSDRGLPPGSPADQALWKSAIDVSNDIVSERSRAGRVQVRLKQGRFTERLSAMAERDPDSAERARDLRRRLEAAWGENFALLTGRWPVDPTRGCQYYALTFATAHSPPRSPSGEALLTQARTDLRACVDKAAPALRAMRESTDRLEAIEAEVDRALAASGPASPTGALEAEAGPGQGAPPPAPAAR